MPAASSSLPGGPVESPDLVQRVFSVGLILQSARSIVGDGPAADRLAAATDELDELIRDVRAQTFDQTRPGLQSQGERMVRTARALLEGAVRNVQILEKQASRAEQPTRLDYETEIKRWRSYADQAARMLERWDQPLSDVSQDDGAPRLPARRGRASQMGTFDPGSHRQSV